MRTKLNAWLPGTPDFVSHRILKDYIQDTARKTGVEGLTIYGAKVKELKKSGDQWALTYSTLRKDSLNGTHREHERSLVSYFSSRAFAFTF
jgi:ACS family pantothenate transporter-like MFS transporter